MEACGLGFPVGSNVAPVWVCLWLLVRAYNFGQLPALPNYPVRHPQDHVIKTTRPVVELHWGSKYFGAWRVKALSFPEHVGHSSSTKAWLPVARGVPLCLGIRWPDPKGPKDPNMVYAGFLY